MITKYPIGKDVNKLSEFFRSLVPDFFSEVDFNNDTITCKDSDGHPLLTLTYNISGYLSIKICTDGKTYNDSTNNTVTCAGWKCKNGAFLDYNAGSAAQYGILITKNNHGIPVIVLSNYRATPFYGDLSIWSWYNDPMLSNGLSYNPVVVNQTMFCPFLCAARYGETSYTPDAFYMPYREDFSGTGEVLVNGISYWTNGYWAIRDE